MPFEPFDLSVMIGGRGQLWVSARSRLGAVYAVPRRRRIARSADLAKAQEHLADAVEYAERDTEHDGRIGAALRELLLGDPEVSALFHRTRGAAADLGRPLLVGVLGAPHEVAALPWELTLDPEGGRHRFLTMAPDAHVVRLARTRTYPIRTDPIPPPLHLLLVLSSPTPSSSDAPALPFDLYEEKRALLDELAPLVAAGKLTVDVEERPSLENLRRRISGRSRGYHVVHYLGHAHPTGLVLENRLGGGRNVDAATFTGLLHACPDLRLVVYAGCLTASLPDASGGAEATTHDDWHRALSIADLSVRVATPAVVGMQALLPFRTERLFVRFFYRALAGGRALPDAVQLARAAIRNDEFVGDLLDWAVPTLFVGGDNPGPLVDPAAPPTAVARPPRVELKLGIEEEERTTFARPVALREAVNVLSGRHRHRVLLVSGNQQLRTPFVGRVLDDLSEDITLVLYLDARELAGKPDPLFELCDLLAELLTRLDHQPRQAEQDWTGAEWWTRLLEEMVGCAAVLAVDGIDELPPAAAQSLGEALRKLALRRGRTRLVIGSTRVCDDLLGDRALRHVLPIQLRPLGFDELLPWIRRNLPELARDGENLRECYEAGLQDDLELWHRLAEETVRAAPGSSPIARARNVLAERRPTTAQPPVPPLRAALTNPDVAGHVKEFAAWMTALAADHRVGGLVLDPARAATHASIAELLPVETPFGANGHAPEAELLDWLETVLQHNPDVLLLDFGGQGLPKTWHGVCRRIAEDCNVLLIAAGGNTPGAGPIYPAWYPEVLAVGALDANGTPTGYSAWSPAEGKPDLFAPEDLSWTRHADLVPADRRGTSFSALGTMAAALLVWSVHRGLTAAQVREVLLDTSVQRRVDRGGRAATYRVLDVSAAVRQARADLLLAVLAGGPAGARELIASTGLARDVALPVLEDLVRAGRLRVGVGDDTERYELVV